MATTKRLRLPESRELPLPETVRYVHIGTISMNGSWNTMTADSITKFPNNWQCIIKVTVNNNSNRVTKVEVVHV